MSRVDNADGNWLFDIESTCNVVGELILIVVDGVQVVHDSMYAGRSYIAALQFVDSHDTCAALGALLMERANVGLYVTATRAVAMRQMAGMLGLSHEALHVTTIAAQRSEYFQHFRWQHVPLRRLRWLAAVGECASSSDLDSGDG